METCRLFAGRGAGGMKMSEDEQIEIKVRDPDFREMIYRTCFMTINGAVFSALMEAGLRGLFPGEDENGVIVYGYIDPVKGICFEILGGGREQNGMVSVLSALQETSASVTKESVNDCRIIPFAGEKIPAFQKKMETIRAMYACPRDLAKVREMDIIDEWRHADIPDRVLVYLMRDGELPEPCWVLTTGLNGRKIKGRLLRDPRGDFGVRGGDDIEFSIHREHGDVICVAQF